MPDVLGVGCDAEVGLSVVESVVVDVVDEAAGRDVDYEAVHEEVLAGRGAAVGE